jgi:uncharacterized protein (TIGR00369 family)
MMIPHFDDNLTPFAHSASNRCFGCGPANPGGLQLEFFVAPDGTLVGATTVSSAFEGHPGYLHGGIIATLLDETMSKAVRAKGLTAMTRHMEIDYRRPVPSGELLRLEGIVVRSEGRKHWAESYIFGGDNTVLAHGKGLFVQVKAR